LLRAFRSRNYRLFFLGQAVALIGGWMQMTAQSWLMYRLTDSAAMVGLLGAAQTGPGLVIGPFAGALADRMDRRRLLMTAQLASLMPSAVIGVLVLADAMSAWLLIALALAGGIVRSAEMPVRQALVPVLVEREHLLNAISLNSALFNSARVIGPALAGAVMAVSNEGWCFLANAASYLAPIAALSAMQFPAFVPPARGSGMLGEVLEGVRYVRGEPFIAALMAALAVASLVAMPYSVVLPSFAREVIGGGSGTYSALTSAVGVGAFATAIALASRRGHGGLERVPAYGAALFGGALVLLSQATTRPVAIPVMVLVGVGFMAQMTTTNTLLQLRVPDRLRGRVMALHSALFLGAVPIGGLVAGALADRIGESAVIATGGGLLLLGSLAFGRRLSRLVPLESAEPGGETLPLVDPEEP
jgi:MFS family permease